MSWPGATARQIARAVRRGDATATTVVAEHITDAAGNPLVGVAYTDTRDSTALAEAAIVDELPDLASLPMAGVPVAVCERFAVTDGQSRLGSSATRLPVAAGDDEMVRRLRGAGSVVVGTTRSSELGLWPSTDDHGDVAVNPWRSDRGVAGPSGGAGLAVASGTVPLAVGQDGPGTAGGVRTVAAACGVIGFSPEHDPAVHRDDTTRWLAGTPGLLATTVNDVAEGYAVLTRSLPPAVSEPPRLRIAATDKTLAPQFPGVSGPLPGPDESTRSWLLTVVRTLTDAGHDTVRSAPTLGPRASTASVSAWAAAAYLRSIRFDRKALQRRTRRLAALGERTVKGHLYGGLLGDGVRTREHALDWFHAGAYDVLVTPALPGPPPAAEGWSTRGLRENLRAGARAAAYTAPWGLIGLPAMVVPVGVRDDGLPATVQLVGKPGHAGVLFDLAGQLVDRLKPRRFPPGL